MVLELLLKYLGKYLIVESFSFLPYKLDGNSAQHSTAAMNNKDNVGESANYGMCTNKVMKYVIL